MSNRLRLAVLAFGVLMIAGDSVSVGERRPRQMRAKPLRGKGDVLAVRPGYLQIRTTTGTTWLMKIEAPPQKIELEGTAEPNWLRPGMFVRFAAKLNGKAIAQAPVTQLTVFTPRPEYRIGVFPDADLAGEEDAGLGEEDESEVERAQQRRAAEASGNYLVAGRLTSFRNGAMRVAAGRASVRAQLAKEAAIEVNLLGDYSFVRPGDHVEFRGKFYQQGQAIVNELKFAAAVPFGRKTAKPASKRPTPKKRQTREKPSADSPKRGKPESE